MANLHPTGGWKPGQSGNPAGKPKDAFGILLRSKEKLPEDIYNAIYPLLQSERLQLRIQAAEFLRDSAWGKPASVVMDENGQMFQFAVIRPDDQRRAA